MKGGGQPLPRSVRDFFEPRFGYDFGSVRVHADAKAVDAAEYVNARAFTVGKDVVFGAGQYKPGFDAGQRLLGHELAHVVQQSRSAYAIIQRSRLLDYKDDKPEHDPSKLTDSEIEATNEYKAYMDKSLVWQSELKVKREEALLACKLILRAMRDGTTVNWKKKARSYVLSARAQLGTLKEAEKRVGHLDWVPLGVSQFTTPSSAGSEFLKWILAGEAEPTDTSKMNCFEMILYAAYKGGFIDKVKLESIYNAAAATGTVSGIAGVFESNLCKGSKLTFDPGDADSPEPLPGDIIIFDTAANHVAISLKKEAGLHKVISLWTPYAGYSKNVVEDSIEALMFYAHVTKVDFCAAPW